MINFFRKIRRKFADNNQFLKYSRYAIGEIVLVVIGILIALQINNRSAQKKLEAKVELIFLDIMDELLADIEETFKPIQQYAQRDSVMRLVLEDHLTIDGYRNNKIPFLYGLINFYNPINFTQNGYDNLIRNLDAVPDNLKPVVKDLNQLYGYNKIAVEGFMAGLLKSIKDNQEYAKRNYSWYYQNLNSDSGWKSNVDYYLSYHYKNEVKDYQGFAKSFLRESINYRQNAIECYNKIARLLEKPVNQERFKIDEEIAKLLVGDWHNENSGIIFTYFLNDGRLYYKNSLNSIKWEAFYLPKHNKILHQGGQNYATIVDENGEMTIKLHWLNLKKVN